MNSAEPQLGATSCVILGRREDSFYGWATALFGSLDAKTRFAWAKRMLGVPTASGEFGDLNLARDAQARRR